MKFKKTFGSIDESYISKLKKAYSYNHLKYIHQLTKELSYKPELKRYIHYLRLCLLRKTKVLNEIKAKMKAEKKPEEIQKVDAFTQTDAITNSDTETSLQSAWNVNMESNTGISLADQVKEAAESALTQSGMVYDDSSGMYYDYNTGYYYNPDMGLYYHNSTGCYYYYNKDVNTFSFHSQAEFESFPNREQVSYDDLSFNPPSKRKGKHKTDVKKVKDNCDESEGTTQSESKESNLNQSEQDKSDVKELSNANKTKDENNIKDETDNDQAIVKSDPIKYEQQVPKKKAGKIGSSNEDGSEDSNSDDGNKYPPCMRIIISETTSENIKVGTLYIVTKEGGTLGREGAHHLIVPDLNISRSHLIFTFDEEKHSYFVKDAGSRNGTILNGKQISSTIEKDSFEVVHGSTIFIGCTKLLCHIHKGDSTCGHCEPGLLIDKGTPIPESTNTYKPTNLKSQHQKELRRLKDKYKVKPLNAETDTNLLPDGYEDKAQLRREKVGSTHHSVKTEQANLDINIASSNKGFKMLQKMGWSEGGGLGKNTQGGTEPVALLSNLGTAGLGSGAVSIGVPTSNQAPPFVNSWRQKVWLTTQKRFDKATTSSIFADPESEEEEESTEKKT